MLSTYLIGAIRTGVPLAVGALAAWLAATLHIVITPDSTAAIAAAAASVCAAAYWLLARTLEARWPKLGVLLGVPVKAATYTPAIGARGARQT